MTHLTVQQLSASLDGALTGPSLELVVRHLAACHECRDRQARLAKHDDALRRLLGQDPDDLFLDDLTRRSEAQVIAISRGMPAPAMVTSVPLLHEEDPHAPVEPPPPPPRPELGRAGELAQEAGWGRIGMKPTAGTHAPESNPEEAQRLLEALESGNVADFTELTAQGLQEHAPLDGPVFDLPAWIKDQSKTSTPKRDGPREVPKLNLFFADLDERAAGLTREAVDEVFRRDDEAAEEDEAPETPAAPPTRPHGLSLVPPLQPTPGVPPEHAAFAPPGWTPESPLASEPTGTDGDRAPASESSSEPRATPSSANMWDLGGFKLPPGAAPEPPRPVPPVLTEPFVVSIGPPRPARRSHARGTDRALVMALVSVGGLLFILVALQLAPAPNEHRGSSATTAGAQPSRITLAPRDATQEEPPARNEPSIVPASTAAPVDQAVPPSDPASPDPAPGGTSKSPGIAPPETPPVVVPKPSNDASGATPAPKPVKPAAGAETTKPAGDRAPANRTANVASEDAPWPLLCGVVLDGSGQPVAGARILATEIAFAVRSDARGRFCLSAPAGTQHLLIEAEGFADSRQTVVLSASTPEVQVQLQAAN